jgi:hypothetical protein
MHLSTRRLTNRVVEATYDGWPWRRRDRSRRLLAIGMTRIGPTSPRPDPNWRRAPTLRPSPSPCLRDPWSLSLLGKRPRVPSERRTSNPLPVDWTNSADIPAVLIHGRLRSERSRSLPCIAVNQSWPASHPPSSSSLKATADWPLTTDAILLGLRRFPHTDAPTAT